MSKSIRSYKQFAQGLVGTVLTGSGVDVELDVPVPDSTEVVDLLFEPKRRVPELAPGDCLERIAATGPGLLACYGDIVRVDDIEASLVKRSDQHQRMQRARAPRQPRPELPHLWIMATCRPRNVMREYEAELMAGWPPGFWTLRREQRLYLVALPALPRTPETLTLRLIPRGPLREQALQEYAELPSDSPIRRALGPLIEAAPQAAEREKPSKGNARDQVQATHDRLVRKSMERGRKGGFAEGFAETFEEGFRETFEEARREGMAEALLQVLAWRFGELPESVTARVARSPKKTLDRWFQRALGAATLREVFAR